MRAQRVADGGSRMVRRALGAGRMAERANSRPPYSLPPTAYSLAQRSGHRLQTTDYGRDARGALGPGRWTQRALALRTPSLQPPAPSRRTAHLSLCAVLLALAGCGSVEPWVKPYERAAFADPIMAPDPHPVSSSYIHHVYEAREGARGASGSAGGGCGCN